MTYVATTVSNAKMLLMEHCRRGYHQSVDRGSFEKSEFVTRRQGFPVHVVMTNPTSFHDLPNGYTEYSLSLYRDELLSAERSGNADYTYGERIVKQFQSILDMLAKTPMTNQAVIRVCEPDDTNLVNPPCLQFLQFMVIRRKLCMSVVFRSNDIDNAFIKNLGGLAMLLRDVAEYTEFKPGTIDYFCPAPHFYVFDNDAEARL